MKKLLIINGPNLNLLDKRNQAIYGDTSFEDFLKVLKKDFSSLELSYFQSNEEGELVNKLQSAKCDAILLNPGAYTHTSVAIADAVEAISTPVLEIHISNPGSREDYRKISLVQDKCVGTIAGLGLDSYRLAIEHLVDEPLDKLGAGDKG